MKILYINHEGKTTEITNLCSNIQWSGDLGQVARKLDFEIADPAYDKNNYHVDISLGGLIKLFYTKEASRENENIEVEIFQGYVFMKEKDFGNQTIKLLCYDGLIYLTKSKASYNFKDTTAEQIAAKMCQDFGIPKGQFAATGIKQSGIFVSKSPYEIIMEAYKKASHRNKKEYVALMYEGKLNIIEKGNKKVDYILNPQTNIQSSRYSESIENMVNRVRIYDDRGNMVKVLNDKGEKVDRIENEKWVNLYGVLQEVYQKESGTDPFSVAKNMLKDVERTGEIEALGNVECIAGNAIQVKECYSGIKGLFYINSDTHSWKDGLHTMRLGLDFERVST